MLADANDVVGCVVVAADGVIGSVIEAVFSETGAGAAVSAIGAAMVVWEGTVGEIGAGASLEISLEEVVVVGVAKAPAAAAAATMGAGAFTAEAIFSLRGSSVV